MKKGYHKMPDGTMMKDSDHPKSGYKHGGMAKKTMGYAKGGMKAKKALWLESYRKYAIYSVCAVNDEAYFLHYSDSM